MRVVAALIVFVAGCAKPEDKPEPAAAPPPAARDARATPPVMTDIDAFAQIVMPGVHEIADAAKAGNCEWFKAASDAFSKNPIKLDAAKKAEFEKKYGKQIDEILVAARDMVAKCADNPSGNVHDIRHADEFGPKLLSLLKRMSAAVVAAKGDCKRMGDNLRPLKAELLALNKISPSGDADKADFDKKFGGQVDNAVAPARVGIAKCKDAPAMKEFMAMF